MHLLARQNSDYNEKLESDAGKSHNTGIGINVNTLPIKDDDKMVMRIDVAAGIINCYIFFFK